MILLQTALLSLSIAGAGETLLLDFYSDSCMPCRQMDPTVRQLMSMGYSVRKVNCSHEPDLARRFHVSQIPCFVMIVDGREVDRVVGATSLARLERMCRLGAARSADASPTQLASSPHDAQPKVVPAVQSGLNLSALSSADATPPGPNLANLIGATVRLRIADSTGHSCGSGTIIDARQGEALILTCGHLFRDSRGKGQIDVDVFGPAPAQRIPGRILHYDLESDLGLLTIRTTGPVVTARVAPPGHRIAKGDAVINVGCNNGEPPTARRSHITSIDKFNGPPNLEVAGLPVQGRSGGGLFASDGCLIGVCNAADPADNEGLYAALSAIHTHLDRMRLSFLYQSPDKQGPAAADAAEPPAMAKQMPRAEEPGPLTEVASRSPKEPAASEDVARNLTEPVPLMSDRERAALEEIQRRRLEGAEVVCVIRPRSDPRAQSEIIVLDHVSPEFLRRLSADPLPSDRRQLTSLDVPQVTEPAGPPADTARPGGTTILQYVAPLAVGSTTDNAR